MMTFGRKNFMSNTSKIELARTSLICTYYLAMQKIVIVSCFMIVLKEFHWNNRKKFLELSRLINRA